MGARILVINDTEEILDLFRIILQDEGYEPLLMGMAFKDVREIERIKPDLIILDYVFGTEKLGWQMVQLLRMYGPTVRLPIIICTAAIREVREIENDLLSHGIRLLPKPFDLDDLIVAVKDALDARSTNVYLRHDDEPDPLDRPKNRRPHDEK